MRYDLQAGQRIDGKYVVKHLLGQGGMGAVYLVHHEVLAVDRALKVIAVDIGAVDGDDDEAAEEAKALKEMLERFNRETKTLARFAHPNIIYATDGGTIHTTVTLRTGKPQELSYPYLVMEYFAGDDGKRWAVSNNPSLERIRQVCLQLAEGLACAHGAGVLHRDLKPQNIIIGANDTAKILDFGLAKDESASRQLTQTGSSLGTLAYLAPEYLSANTRGRRHTQLTDLWGLGCIFYFLLTHRGVHPHLSDEGELQFYHRVMKGEYEPVETFRTDISAEFARVVSGLLEKDPLKRTATAQAVVAQLQAITAVSDASRPAFVPPRHRRMTQLARHTPTESFTGSAGGTVGAGAVGAAGAARAAGAHASSGELLFSDPSPGSSGGERSPVFQSCSAQGPAAGDNSLVDLPSLPQAGLPSLLRVDVPTIDGRKRALPSDSAVDREMAAMAQAFDPSRSASSQQAAPRSTGEPGQHTLMRMLTAEVDGNANGHMVQVAAVAPAAVQSVSEEYRDEDKPTPSQMSVVLPPPTFSPATRASPRETQAKKSVVLPAAIAGSLALLGLVVMLTLDFGSSDKPQVASAAGGDKLAASPDDEKRRIDAENEMRSLQDEQRRKSAEEKQRQALLAAAMANPRLGAPQTPEAAPSEALPDAPFPQPVAAPPQVAQGTGQRPSNSGSHATSAPAAAPTPSPSPSPDASSPWGRYGNRTTNTGATTTGAAATTASAAPDSRRNGVRVPVRVNADLVSSPAGPVIALVTQQTDIGDVTIPAGTEIHGTTSGSSGTRLFVTFTTAIVGGKNVSLSGSALGLDGKAGIPGNPSGADGTDVLAGAASATVSALGGAAAVAVGGGVPGAAIQGATSPAAGNTSRINTSQTMVSTKRGARFLIYINGR